MARQDAMPHNVECPECGRVWTGLFSNPLPDKAVCKDCIAANKMPTDKHRDHVINPGQD